MSRRNRRNQSSGSVARALRCTIEALEQRLHLSADDRGKISVIVEGSIASALTAELTQYQQDLIGDGWSVSMHTNAPKMIDDDNVWDNSDPTPFAQATTTTQYRADLQTVKDMIADDAEDGTLKAIVIVGHVTVPYSGITSYDGHSPPGRAMPTDQYYADLHASPQTWGDLVRNYNPGTDYQYEWTPDAERGSLLISAGF